MRLRLFWHSLFLCHIPTHSKYAAPNFLLMVQPLTATDDPMVLGIKPIPNIQQKISDMIAKYRAETLDIEDVEFEEADLEENVLFPNIAIR